MRRLLSTLLSLSVPAPLFAQTAEIQREVETKLWFARFSEGIESATGMPPLVLLMVLLILLGTLGIGVWLWRSRTRRSD